MPEAITVEVTGLDELRAKLSQLESELSRGALIAAMQKAVMLVTRETKASRYMPVDTGRLRSSITPEVVQQTEIVQGIVGSNVVYAPYQELGTRYMEGKRFLQRALEENKNEIIRIFEEALSEAIRK